MRCLNKNSENFVLAGP